MLCPVEMFGGVFVFRRIAAAYVPARKTHAKVDPRIAGFDTLFSLVLVCILYLDLIKVGAFRCHRLLLFLLL